MRRYPTKLRSCEKAYNPKCCRAPPLNSTNRLSAVGTPWHTIATPKNTPAWRRSSTKEASRISPIAIGRNWVVAIVPPRRLKCLRDAGHASPDRAAVHAASWSRDARARRARARAGGTRLTHGRNRVRRRGPRPRVPAPGTGDPAASDPDTRCRGEPVEHARRCRLGPHGVPAVLGLLPAVRGAEWRPDARQASHGHPRRD